jgi:hypothetical protein
MTRERWGTEKPVQRTDRDRRYEGEELLQAFTAREAINVCPGWQMSYSWKIDDAERLDSRRTGQFKRSDFGARVEVKLREAFSAMGQDFDGMISGRTPYPSE